MKSVKYFILAAWVVLAATGCRKDNINNGPLAIKAEDFLSSRKYEKLQVEICYVQGFEPDQNSLDQLKSFLDARIHKPEGISFKYTSIPATGKSSYDLDDINEIEKDYRNDFSRHDELVVFVFFADAPYAQGEVLGLAYGTTACAIFEKTVQDNSGGIGQPTQVVLETTVLEHEFGHLIGLVDAGTPMVSAHASDGHHCNNQSCLMYYAVETLDVIANLAGGEVPSLDANCIADLQANGGK